MVPVHPPPWIECNVSTCELRVSNWCHRAMCFIIRRRVEEKTRSSADDLGTDVEHGDVLVVARENDSDSAIGNGIRRAKVPNDIARVRQ